MGSSKALGGTKHSTVFTDYFYNTDKGHPLIAPKEIHDLYDQYNPDEGTPIRCKVCRKEYTTVSDKWLKHFSMLKGIEKIPYIDFDEKGNWYPTGRCPDCVEFPDYLLYRYGKLERRGSSGLPLKVEKLIEIKRREDIKKIKAIK